MCPSNVPASFPATVGYSLVKIEGKWLILMVDLENASHPVYQFDATRFKSVVGSASGAWDSTTDFVSTMIIPFTPPVRYASVADHPEIGFIADVISKNGVQMDKGGFFDVVQLNVESSGEELELYTLIGSDQSGAKKFMMGVRGVSHASSPGIFSSLDKSLSVDTEFHLMVDAQRGVKRKHQKANNAAGAVVNGSGTHEQNDKYQLGGLVMHQSWNKDPSKKALLVQSLKLELVPNKDLGKLCWLNV